MRIKVGNVQECIKTEMFYSHTHTHKFLVLYKTHLSCNISWRLWYIHCKNTTQWDGNKTVYCSLSTTLLERKHYFLLQFYSTKIYICNISFTFCRKITLQLIIKTQKSFTVYNYILLGILCKSTINFTRKYVAN